MPVMTSTRFVKTFSREILDRFGQLWLECKSLKDISEILQSEFSLRFQDTLFLHDRYFENHPRQPKAVQACIRAWGDDRLQLQKSKVRSFAPNHSMKPLRSTVSDAIPVPEFQLHALRERAKRVRLIAESWKGLSPTQRERLTHFRKPRPK